MHSEGPRGLLARVFSGLARGLGSPAQLPSVRTEDVLRADLTESWTPPFRRITPTDNLVINWVMPPPGENSGGHTTSFRLIRYLKDRGHTSRIYFYDVYGGDLEYYSNLLRRSYADVEVASAFEGMPDADAVFATCWETAYFVYNARTAGKRFYLVQDYEPWFYPESATAALAMNTYRMGFHAITAGTWLSARLTSEFGMAADPFEFGCDTDTYKVSDAQRDGVVFYARPNAPRRAFELGMLALELFAERHPSITIHAYGDTIRQAGSLRFPVVNHGLVSPERLNEIYNRCFAGLTLSMTNVSLVPHEMLAAGCIPVVNDAEHNRIVLANEHVRYASPSPHELAQALGAIVTDPDFNSTAKRAAASVRTASWDRAGEAVEAVLRRELLERSTPP